jgi:hypothetical protein
LKGKLSQLPTNNTVLVFKLFTTNTPKQELLTMPVTLSPAGYTPPLKDITMTYAITNGVGTKSYTVTLSTNAADSQLSAAKEIIKSQLEQNKPSSDMSSNTVLNIRVNDIKGANLGVTNTTTTTTGGSQK